jgi:hypothetical protein
MSAPVHFRSRVNQPERVFLNSSDDARTQANVGFSDFQALFRTPILAAKRAQLLRATIPNCQINIPDYQLVFWYYNLPTATTVPSAATLKAVRLYPSSYIAPAALGAAFTKNRYFSDPADFVTQLNTAASAAGDNVTYNPFWTAGDITFTYNASTKQISITGNTAGRFYAPAGWNDPVVSAAAAGGTITMLNAVGGATTVQPLLAQYTLNLRVGYAMSGLAFANQGTQGLSAYADLTNRAYANAVAIPTDSFPNLVYSQCVYMYADFVSGSGLGSNSTYNILAVVPSNAPQLGVIQYTALTLNWMTKIAQDIYEITIFMRDDANQPFVLPDSAQVNVELAIGYNEAYQNP